jgi:hypothetical protein
MPSLRLLPIQSKTPLIKEEGKAKKEKREKRRMLLESVFYARGPRSAPESNNNNSSLHQA